MASQEKAWFWSVDRDGCSTWSVRGDEEIVADVSLKHYTEWMSDMPMGFARAVVPQVGSVYYILAHRHRNISALGFQGDRGSSQCFSKNYMDGEAISDVFDYEGIVLTPGLVL